MKVSRLMKKVLPAVLGLMVAWAGPALAGAKVRAFVSILPQKYFVERIGGDLVDVSVLVLPGANPHMYEPSPRQMTALAGAQVFFAIGVNLEEVWLPKLADANQTMRIVRTQKGVEKIPMTAHGHGEHEAMHGEHGGEEPGHGILDPHIWLDPVRVKIIARNTCDGLVRVDPAHQAVYETNLAAFLKDLDSLNASIAKSLAVIPADKRTFMVFHPSWGYFAKRYGLTQVAIEAGGSEPSPRHLAEIIEHGRELGVSVVFVQPQFSRRSADVIASELGARVVPLDPLAENWKDNLLHAADAFGQALR
ncbi:metal ABC transporter solute-binding protein, Zn/Mn family [Pseudodesulfovibrio methanolicus]|uniref:Zinc ABC transporter substrate-binding protein n=1 Tax=Pseudodesulfovibrio methanolicus TaxID=3126690 RepID=A0ABZ2IYH9_9BACT